MIIKKAIILGNDHSNSLGVVQSLGLVGFDVTTFVWGVKTGLLQSSRYTKAFYYSNSADECVDKILYVFSREVAPVPIIACCDTAAIVLEKNAERLFGKFVFEHVRGIYTLAQLQEKDLQIRLANTSGFNVPKSIELNDSSDVIKKPDFAGPYLIKPLMSIEGSKSDITICKDYEDLVVVISKIHRKTPRILLQQYINKDFELSILGLARTNREVFIPAKEIKLTIYPPKVGLESKAIMKELCEESLIKAIKTIINTIDYVGLFSIELMHNPNDNKYYFTEMNLRNDGAQPFFRKYGYNLPLMHIQDLVDDTITIHDNTRPGLYLWEMHHLQSFLKHNISFKVWLSDIIKAKGFLLTCKNDYLPFFKQFFNKFSLSKRLCKKNKSFYK